MLFISSRPQCVNQEGSASAADDEAYLGNLSTGIDIPYVVETHICDP